MRKRLWAGVVGLALCSCGSGLGQVTVQEVSSDNPSLPNMTVDRIQGCFATYGGQLGPGRHQFNPVVEVNQDGVKRGVSTPDMPDTAPDLAACTRIALSDMAIPSAVFQMRKAQSTASTNASTVEQRSLVGNPGVVVVVVVVEVALAEIVLEAGAITILFATTVKVVDDAKDDVLEAAKRWKPKLTKSHCYDAAAGGQYLWEAMCQSLSGVRAALCWKHANSTETEKRNLCNSWFVN